MVLNPYNVLVQLCLLQEWFGPIAPCELFVFVFFWCWISHFTGSLLIIIQCLWCLWTIVSDREPHLIHLIHYGDVIMSAMASQITSLTIVCSVVCADVDQRKHQSSASLAFVRGIHRWPVNSPHKVPVTRKMFPFDDIIMWSCFNGPPYHDYNSNYDVLKACLMSRTVEQWHFCGNYLPYLYIGLPCSNGHMISKFFI